MKRSCRSITILALLLIMAMAPSLQAAEKLPDNDCQKPGACSGTEVTTEELKHILKEGRIPVIDVRPPKEYAVSHVPGALSIFEKEIDQMIKVTPDKTSGPVLYCNGPFCHKTIRVAEKLSQKGYTNVRKYRQGLPVWRAFGNTAETSLSGFKYVYASDKTAVFVDARPQDEYRAGTVPGALNIPDTKEIEAANNDGRLPYADHGTRVIVFGSSIAQARHLAGAIAERAYWNSSYVSATYQELKKAGF